MMNAAGDERFITPTHHSNRLSRATIPIYHIYSQLDKKKKIAKNTIFHFNNFFFEKCVFINLKFGIFYLSWPAGKTNWTVVINFPQNCSRSGRKMILIRYLSMNFY